MTTSSAHQLTKKISHLLEEIIQDLLQDFCSKKSLYVNKKEKRHLRGNRDSSWLDNYQNSHDLDFIIEKNGSDTAHGRPVAFIEAAWRRYASHLNNATQKNQALPQPFAEKHDKNKSFRSVILASCFTEPSSLQIKNSNFTVALFSYETIVAAFETVHITINHDENTAEKEIADALATFETLSEQDISLLKQTLIKLNNECILSFLTQLSAALDRQIEELVIVPLYGNKYSFFSIDAAGSFLSEYKKEETGITFNSFKTAVRFANGDKITATFHTKKEIQNFLNYVANR